MNRTRKRPVTFRCSSCNRPVQRAKVGSGLCRNCSQRENAMRRDYTRSGEVKACPVCGAEVYFTPSELARGRRYCSKACSNRARRREAACSVCGGPCRPWRKSCDAESCKREVRRRAKLGAKNPNAGPQVGDRAAWRAAKAKKCASCGGRSRLRLHHVVYEQHVRRAGGNVFDPDNSLTLCWDCHNRHHHSPDGRLRASGLRPENIDFAFALLGAAAFDYFNRYYDNDVPALAERAGVSDYVPWDAA